MHNVSNKFLFLMYNARDIQIGWACGYCLNILILGNSQ